MSDLDLARRPLSPLARRPVLAALVTVGLVLTAFSDRYGYHRDELYFRMLPTAWGYVDQPPLTPALAHLFSAVFADAPWAIRIPATLAVLASLYVLVLVTREFGGDRRAQTLCAWGYGTAAIPLIMGHVLLTASIDLPVWPLILLFVARAQLRREPRWWLAAGAVVGVSLYNKLLVAVLLAAMLGGLVLLGPRPLLWSKWVLGAVALAVLVGSPNLIYQASHGWPQLKMGRALAQHNGGDVRVSMWPFLLIMMGPPLVPIWIAGLVALARRPGWRAVRFLAAAFPVLLALVFIMGSQQYYSFGFVATLFGIGCGPAVAWIGTHRWRRLLVIAAVALNAAVTVTLGLPVIPLGTLGQTPVPGINQVARDTVGWPAYVREVAAAYATVPASDQPNTVIIASNYGEAGAVARYGGRYHLPRVYSGQNELYSVARPPSTARTAVVLGGQVEPARELFRACSPAGELDNGLDVDNEEQHLPIVVCRDPIGGWDTVWRQLRHLD